MSTDKRSRGPTAEGLSTTPRWQRRRLAVRGPRRSRLGPAAGMIGGALVAIGTFLPWLEFNGRVRSGWEIYDLYSAVGTPAVISPMFGGGEYDIFFTGLVTLPLGILSALLMAAMLIANTKSPPTKVKARAVLVVSATLMFATALVITAVNIRTARLGTLGFEQSPVHYGLWVMFVGGWAGTIGVAVSIRGKRQRAQKRAERETVATAPEPLVTDKPVTDKPVTDSPVSDSQPLAPPAPSRSTSTAQRTARAFAMLLLLVGLGGYVVAAAADSSVAKTSVADERALGQQDPATAAKALRSRVTPIKGAYDTYVAASLAVVSARGDVNKLFNQVRSPSTSGSLGVAGAKDKLSKGIAAYGAAVERANVARKAYADQLALLMAEVHR